MGAGTGAGAVTAFDRAALADFAALYPEAPGLLHHGLVGHPLFELDALVRLAQRMRPGDVEQNIGDLPIGIDPAAVAHNGLSVVETIRSIEHAGAWMVLKFVEQDAAYRALLEAALGELIPVVGAATGAMLKMEAFVFISSPGAVTPFHFDPEHNILLQLRGHKVMTLFPAADEARWCRGRCMRRSTSAGIAICRIARRSPPRAARSRWRRAMPSMCR